MIKSKCKTCRKLGVKLFLKGEKCLSSKCLMVKKPYRPGNQGKRRRRHLSSNYARELLEKQKLKNWYNLREKQFRNYFKEVLAKKTKSENIGDVLVRKLESRLDNVVFRMGFASSRSWARQMVSHGHFLVNGRKVDIPSYLTKKGDKVSLKQESFKKALFKRISEKLKNYTPPSWIKVDAKKLEGEIIGKPSLEEAGLPVELSIVFEYYSR